MNITMNLPDLDQFVAVENQYFTRTLEMCPDEIEIAERIQGLYISAMKDQNINPYDATLLHLLGLIHYNFLFSTATCARGHLAEAGNSARVAIDAALIAAHIIYDRSSQTAYIERKPPFDKLQRHYNNKIKNKEPLPNFLIPDLIKRHGFFSQYASHADVDAFVYRSEFIKNAEKTSLRVSYFQVPQNMDHFKHHFLGIMHTFVTTLDIFSDYFINERKTSPATWRSELILLGKQIEDRQTKLMPKEKVSTA